MPYVPTPDLPLLQRDTFAFESPLSYDGGQDGTEILRRVLADSPRFLRRGGALLLELGGDQADALRGDLERLGYVDVSVLVDEDGDVRGIEATLGSRARASSRIVHGLDRVDPQVASRSMGRARTWRGRRPRDSASTAWATRPSSASGPPRTMKPASTSSSMYAACASQLGLLLQRPRPVELGAGLAQHDEEHRHARVVAHVRQPGTAGCGKRGGSLAGARQHQHGGQHERAARELHRPEPLAEDGMTSPDGDHGLDARDDARRRRPDARRAPARTWDRADGRDQRERDDPAQPTAAKPRSGAAGEQAVGPERAAAPVVTRAPRRNGSTRPTTLSLISM